MTYLSAALLGLLQGITEFLPVSSLGHLALVQNVFHMEGADLTFDAMLHVGTLLPLLLFFRKDIRSARRGALGLLGMGKDRGKRTPGVRHRRRLALFLLAGSLPLLLALPLWGAAEKCGQSTPAVGCMLLLSGGVLWLGDRFSAEKKKKQENQISLSDLMLVGLGQVPGVMPGLSRAGITISIGMLRGFSCSAAVRYSYLLSIPAVLGAAVNGLIRGSGFSSVYLVGMLTAAVSGYFSIRLLRWISGRNGLRGFAYYCWGAGIVALMLSLVS